MPVSPVTGLPFSWREVAAVFPGSVRRAAGPNLRFDFDLDLDLTFDLDLAFDLDLDLAFDLDFAFAGCDVPDLALGVPLGWG